MIDDWQPCRLKNLHIVSLVPSTPNDLSYNISVGHTELNFAGSSGGIDLWFLLWWLVSEPSQIFIKVDLIPENGSSLLDSRGNGPVTGLVNQLKKRWLLGDELYYLSNYFLGSKTDLVGKMGTLWFRNGRQSIKIKECNKHDNKFESSICIMCTRFLSAIANGSSLTIKPHNFPIDILWPYGYYVRKYMSSKNFIYWIICCYPFLWKINHWQYLFRWETFWGAR